jgi:putative ATP-dependent endonuclease of OLD family
MLFAHGIILVEGDAERFLVPTFAETICKPLDHLGITVCSVAGTNFHPYAKLLAGLGIPFSIITDWDPTASGGSLGATRAEKLIRMIELIRSGEVAEELDAALEGTDGDEFCDLAARYGVFLNDHTLEVDLFNDEFGPAIIDTLLEHGFGSTRRGWIDEWKANPDELDIKKFLSLLDTIGKGRFAQRLASRMGDLEPPAYISEAIRFVADRV